MSSDGLGFKIPLLALNSVLSVNRLRTSGTFTRKMAVTMGLPGVTNLRVFLAMEPLL